MDNVKQRKPKILIVDDVPKNIQVAANILKRGDYIISFADNGRTALSVARKNLPDLILLDVMMPEMDGFETCTELKKDELTKDIPVIFLTAKIETENVIKGFEIGAADYVLKPFNSEELLARVRTHVQLKLTYEDLKKSESDLREANTAKDKFFSIIAHDIRGPFTTIIGFLEILLMDIEGLDKDTIRKYVQKSYSSTRLVMNLLENLLHWARSQTGRIDYQPEVIDLAGIVDETTVFLKSTAENKEISLVSSMNSSVKAYADRNMIITVIRNLISNGIKFTEKGGKIEITAEQKDGIIELCVSDNGIGIDENDMDKLFKIEVHHTTKGTEKEKGTGLGLIICKEFIEKNGGEIHVDSRKNKGSIFRFTLPAQISRAE